MAGTMALRAVALAASAGILLAGAARGQDIRGLGMGGMRFIVTGDADRLDLYGFGDNPAGLVSAPPPLEESTWSGDYTSGELYLAGLSMSFERFLDLSFGQTVPPVVRRIQPVEIAGTDWYNAESPARPAGFSCRSRRGATAFAGRASFAWLQTSDSSVPAWTTAVPELSGTWCASSGRYDYGADLSVFDVMEKSGVQHAGAGSVVGIGRQTGTTSWGASAGYVQVRTLDGSSAEDPHTDHGARGTATYIFEPARNLRVGGQADCRWGAEQGAGRLAPALRVRALYDPPGPGGTADAELAWFSSYAERGPAWLNRLGVEYALGLGYRMGNLLTGVEFSGSDERYAWPGEAGPWSGYARTDLMLGAEYRLAGLCLRTGAGFGGRGTTGVTWISYMTAAAGIGWQRGPLRLDLAYNKNKYESNFTWFDWSSHLVVLSLRYNATR